MKKYILAALVAATVVTAGCELPEEPGASEGGKSGVVGKAITNAGTTYQVNRASTTQYLGERPYGEQADGTFVVVDMQLTNNKDETKTFMESNAKLVTSDGNKYETTDKAMMAFGDNDLMMEDIQPDLTTRGSMAFELPPNKVAGAKLVIEDLWGSGEITVDLGLA